MRPKRWCRGKKDTEMTNLKELATYLERQRAHAEYMHGKTVANKADHVYYQGRMSAFFDAIEVVNATIEETEQPDDQPTAQEIADSDEQDWRHFANQCGR